MRRDETMSERLERSLAYCSKADERLVGELSLAGVDLNILQTLFELADDDPMYEVFPVGPAQAAALQPYVSEAIDLDRYNYYVECHAVPEDPVTAPSR